MQVFRLQWPELDASVRVKAAEENPHVFDWFCTNLPTKSLQTHTVVAGYCLTSMSVPVRNPFPWTLDSLYQEDLVVLRPGRALLNMTIGNVVNLGFKWAGMTENMKYAVWSEVVPEDLPTLRKVGATVWANMMSAEKRLIHVEFVAA